MAAMRRSSGNAARPLLPREGRPGRSAPSLRGRHPPQDSFVELKTLQSSMGPEFHTKVLRLTAEVLGLSGMELMTLAEQIAPSLKRRVRASAGPRSPSFVIDLPHVLAYWRSHTRFLHRGIPRALPFRSKTGPCVAEIIAQVYPNMDPRPVMAALRRNGAVVRRDRLYKPASREIVFRHDQESAQIYGRISLLGLLLTVKANLKRPGSYVQRSAINTHFPISAEPEFHNRSDEAAELALHALDEFMIHREVPAQGTKPTVLRGCSYFDFEIPAVSPSKADEAPGRAKSTRRRNRGI
jgi:hypothetical protein